MTPSTSISPSPSLSPSRSVSPSATSGLSVTPSPSPSWSPGMCTGVVTTLAGGGGPGGTAGGYADGRGSAALFSGGRGIAADPAGNLFVADTDNCRIRAITADGNVSTLTGGWCGYADGSGTSSNFYYPQGIAFIGGSAASGNGTLVVADTYSHCIRLVPIAVSDIASRLFSAGAISPLAGFCNSFWMTGRADGTGTSARFYFPAAVAVDALGTVFAVDRGNNVIRAVSLSTGNVTTLAGGGGPLGTSCGNANGVGSAASFCNPSGVAADTLGNVFVADSGYGLLRAIVVSTGAVTTIASFSNIASVAVGLNIVYVSAQLFTCNSVSCGSAPFIYSVSTTTGAVATLAGGAQGSSNGIGTNAQFASGSLALAFGGNNGDVFAFDADNRQVRVVAIAPVLCPSTSPSRTVTPSTSISPSSSAGPLSSSTATFSYSPLAPTPTQFSFSYTAPSTPSPSASSSVASTTSPSATSSPRYCPASTTASCSSGAFSSCASCIAQYQSDNGGYACYWRSGVCAALATNPGNSPSWYAFFTGNGSTMDAATICAATKAGSFAMYDAAMAHGACADRDTQSACLGAYPGTLACYWSPPSGAAAGACSMLRIAEGVPFGATTFFDQSGCGGAAPSEALSQSQSQSPPPSPSQL